MTLREIAIETRAAADDNRDRLRVAQATGWFAEVYARHKKLPPIERILRPNAEDDLTPEERERRQTHLLKRLAVLTGGQSMEIKH